MSSYARNGYGGNKVKSKAECSRISFSILLLSVERISLLTLFHYKIVNEVGETQTIKQVLDERSSNQQNQRIYPVKQP